MKVSKFGRLKVKNQERESNSHNSWRDKNLNPLVLFLNDWNGHNNSHLLHQFNFLFKKYAVIT
jgi:hypothetical protein